MSILDSVRKIVAEKENFKMILNQRDLRSEKLVKTLNTTRSLAVGLSLTLLSVSSLLVCVHLGSEKEQRALEKSSEQEKKILTSQIKLFQDRVKSLESKVSQPTPMKEAVADKTEAVSKPVLQGAGKAIIGGSLVLASLYFVSK